MPEIKIKPKFEMGQVVYLKTDPDKWERIVTAYYVTPTGLLYELRCSDEYQSIHSYIEIEEPKNAI